MAVYEVEAACVQNASNVLVWGACVKVDGEVAAGSTNCVVTMYQADGDNTRTAQAGVTDTVASPIADNTFNGSFTVALTEGALYYFTVDITNAAAVREGIMWLAVPVRTTA